METIDVIGLMKIQSRYFKIDGRLFNHLIILTDNNSSSTTGSDGSAPGSDSEPLIVIVIGLQFNDTFCQLCKSV